MPDIHIDRRHDLSAEETQALLQTWMTEGEEKLGLSCRLSDATERPQEADAVVHLERAGVTGSLTALPGRFVLDAELGFLFRAFAPAITRQIEQNLDELLGARGA